MGTLLVLGVNRVDPIDHGPSDTCEVCVLDVVRAIGVVDVVGCVDDVDVVVDFTVEALVVVVIVRSKTINQTNLCNCSLWCYRKVESNFISVKFNVIF